MTKDNIPERSHIQEEYRWNLAAMYGSDDAWEQDFETVDSKLKPLLALKDKLSSPSQVAIMLDCETALDRLLEKLFTYAHLKADEDTADSDNQGRLARIRSRITQVSGGLAWIIPEILQHDEATLTAWRDDPCLADHGYTMSQLLRRKAHTLSEAEETLLSRAGEILDASHQTFNLLTNADMRFPPVNDEQGHERVLSEGRYITFLVNRDRRVRKDAFCNLYDSYHGLRNTLASTLSSTVKLHNYQATVRHYPSALEAGLHSDQIPVSLYDNLIQATRAALPAFESYLELRRDLLKVPALDMYDMYVSIVPDFDMQIPFDQARQWILAACEPLGPDYIDMLSQAFTDRWLDVYENRGKRSGAYSSGCYDSNPYILLNYHGTLDHVFTLAHELGHSMHTWLANQAQTHRYAQYPIFIAEIASTLNEALLLEYLLAHSDDPRMRAYLLNHQADAFKGTVYRQVMFAEFERFLHQEDARQQPLTPDFLSESYYKLNAAYYPGVDPHGQIAMEWARIPHFYYNFYVYKYATSFCASQIFCRRILENTAQRDAYLDLLRAGGSAAPLELIRRAGVDLADPATLSGSFTAFGQTVKQLGTALKELG
jgi:oligoendopeptidase F